MYILIPRLVLGTFLVLFSFSSKAQDLERLYEEEKFEKLITHAKDTATLDGYECYYIGYAYFQLEDDEKAIKMYDAAMVKGLNEDFVYLYKGLSLRYSKQYAKAIPVLKEAISRNPSSQLNCTELGNVFYDQEEYDSALVYFYKARTLDFETGDPYVKIPNIYHLQENYEKALTEYRISADLIDNTDTHYLELLLSIGLLEYTFTKNYATASDVYNELISLAPQEYEWYPKLIKAYYANGKYEDGNHIFEILKEGYQKKLLPEDMQEHGSAAIDEFEWNGQTLIAYRKFEDPKEMLGIKYKVYLLSAEGEIERTLMTEKTIQLGENGAKHLLCERGKDGTHYTYAYGWSIDDFEYTSLKDAIIKVLNGELKPAATSRAAAVPESGKRNKKRKN